jgi:hypothetical protein
LSACAGLTSPSASGFAGGASGFVFDSSVEVRSLVLLRAGSALFAELDADDVEAADPLEVSDIRGPDAPAGADGGGGDESVVGADIDTGGGELSPEAGVRACAQEVEGEWWEGCEDGLDEGLPPGPVLGGGAMDAVEQF